MLYSLIHVSDLHFQNNHLSKERLRLLKQDIIGNTKDGPHYLIFSGDLVGAGDDALYDVLLDEFFIDLYELVKGIYLVPGNHDLQQSCVSLCQRSAMYGDSTHAYLYGSGNTHNFGNPFIDTDPLANYRAFQELVASYQDANYFGSYDNNRHFSIACLNSVWLSGAGLKEQSDLGKLRIDPPILQYFIEKLDRDKVNVFMAHHPLEWLDERVRQAVENLITENFDIALFGHTHNPKSTSGFFNGGKCLFLRAPALLSGTSYGSNAYTIVNIDGENKRFEIQYRTFSEPRKCFVPGEELASKGVKYPSPADQTHWYHVRNRTRSGLLIRFKNEHKNIDFPEWHETHFIGKSKSKHNFVEPRVTKIKYQDGERLEAREQKLTSAIEHSVHRQFVIGPQDSGLTTAAFLAAKHIAMNIDKFDAVPVYVNLNEGSINKATLLRWATRTAPVRYSRSEIKTLAEHGGVFFVFDQVGLPETSRINKAIRTLNHYLPNCKAVFFCAADGGLLKSKMIDDDLLIDPIDDTVFQMLQFDVEEIGELIRGSRPDATNSEQTAILRNVVASFQQMSEPVYPSAVTLLIETLRQIPEFRPINRARLIDRYVECLLGRLEWEDVTEGTFNSTDKVNFLSYLAGRFALAFSAEITEEEWNEICSEYSTGRLLELPSDLLEEFTIKGILVRQNGGITFRADYLFTYFVAKEMNQDVGVYKFIAADEAFFSNYRELIFYGELEGVDNGRLLNDTRKRLVALETKIVESYRNDGIDFDREWENMLSENAIEDTAKVGEAINAAITEVPTSKTATKALARDLTDVDRSRGVVQRVTVRELEAQWFVAINTYFQLVKHSAGLPGLEKLRHLTKAVESAELFIKSVAAKREFISSRPTYFYSGILYINPLARTDPNRARKEFKFAAPSTFARLLTESMSNAQLAPAFRKLLEEDSEIVKFLVRHLLLEIPSESNRQAFVESLEDATQPVLQACTLNRLKHKYLGYSTTDVVRSYYDEIIEDLVRQSSLREKIQPEQLRKRRLLVDMRKRTT